MKLLPTLIPACAALGLLSGSVESLKAQREAIPTMQPMESAGPGYIGNTGDASSPGSMAASALEWCRNRLARTTTFSQLCRNRGLARLFTASKEANRVLNDFFNYGGVVSRRTVIPDSGLVNIEILKDPNSPAHAVKFIYATICRSPLISACLRLEEVFKAVPGERSEEEPSVQQIDDMISGIALPPPETSGNQLEEPMPVIEPLDFEQGGQEAPAELEPPSEELPSGEEPGIQPEKSENPVLDATEDATTGLPSGEVPGMQPAQLEDPALQATEDAPAPLSKAP